MPRGSKPGEHRGGRQKGSSNKRSKEIADRVMSEGITMAEIMVGAARAMWDAARLPDGSVKDLEMAKEAGELAVKAAPYFHPKLAAIEHTGKDGGAIQSALAVTAMTEAKFEEIAKRVVDEF